MVFEKIRKIISEQVDIEEEKITIKTSLLKDLEADSLESGSRKAQRPFVLLFFTLQAKQLTSVDRKSVV